MTIAANGRPPIDCLPVAEQKRPVDARVSALVGRRLADVERDLIAATLARTGGNRSWAADILGLTTLELRDRLISFERCSETVAETGRPSDRLRELLERYDFGPARPS